MVAERSQESSDKITLRDGPNHRGHFVQKLCNRGIKPTENSGKKNYAKRWPHEINESILVNESTAILEPILERISTTAARKRVGRSSDRVLPDDGPDDTSKKRKINSIDAYKSNNSNTTKIIR